MSEDNRKIVVCAPIDGSHTSDSIVIDAGCGHQVWIAPAGKAYMDDNPDAEAQCITCALPAMKESGVAPMAVPGVLDDVEREAGSWERAKMEQFMRRLGIVPNG